MSHQWQYLRETMGGEQSVGPMTEPEFVAAVRAGQVKQKTKVLSPTRTKGTWVYASQLPKVAELITKATEKAKAEKKLAAEQRATEKAVQKAERAKVKSEKRAQKQHEMEVKGFHESTFAHLQNDGTAICGFCDNRISANAVKCKHCGEFVNKELHRQHLPNKFSPGLAAVLSLIPGLGQLYQGKVLAGIAWFFSIVFCYAFSFLIIPFFLGLLLHVICIVSAAKADPKPNIS